MYEVEFDAHVDIFELREMGIMSLSSLLSLPPAS
jgi:hypothetical protein